MPLSGSILLGLLNALMPLPANPAAPEAISFFRERVEVEVIDPGPDGEWAIAVHGIYHFRRPGSAAEAKRYGIFYPFPLGDGAHYPDEITVSHPAGEEGGRAPVHFQRAAEGVSIPVLFRPGHSTAEFTVDYRQRTGRPGGVYITKTTRAWGRPLERAEFIVRVPKTLRLTSIAYPPDRTEAVDGQTLYTVTIDDFMPDEDLRIEWERGE